MMDATQECVSDSLVLCRECRLFHRLPYDARIALASAQGFVDRHPGHTVVFAPHVDGHVALPGGASGWRGNADVKLAYQTEQTMTITALNSMASSATAGWQSAVVDNTANLFDETHVQVVIDFAATAPANSKAVFIYAYGGLNTTYTNPASGTQGSITLLDITANPQMLQLIGVMPYTTSGEVAESSPISVASAFGGKLAPKWGIVIMNHTGAAIAATGNAVTYRGIYSTVI